MTLRVIRRRRARLDIEEAAFRYAEEAGATIAWRFVAAVEMAMRHIAEHPATGPLRYAKFGSGAPLRFWRVRGFPYLVFYVGRAEAIDVWRVLHAERDIPRWLTVED